jgi:trigger factor
MEINLNEEKENIKEFTVVLEPEEVEKHCDQAAKIISSESIIDGFRPGMAPREIVEEKTGKERVWREACNVALKKTYQEILNEKNYFIISPPEIEIQSMETDKPFSYKIKIHVMPEINLPDYKKIAQKTLKEKKKVEVKDEEITNALETVRKSRAKVKLVDREAKKGDEVFITFQGSVNGVTQDNLKAEKLPLILGENKFIPGFEEKIVNLKAGENTEFSLDVPADNQKTQKIDFKVNLVSVNERELPELNDEFAQSLGEFTNLENLTEKIKENIEHEKEHHEKERIRVKILENIGKETKVTLPEAMVERELDNMLNEFKENLSLSGLSLESYLERTQKTIEEIKKDWQEKARKRILMSLILNEVALKENIQVSQEEIDQEANNYLANLKTKENLPEPEKLKLYLKDIIQNNKTLSLLEESEPDSCH